MLSLRQEYEIKKQPDVKKKRIYMLLAVMIAFIFILPQDITWARDRHNYLRLAEYAKVFLNMRLEGGFISFLANEPFFLLINILLSSIFQPEGVVKILIFGSTLGVLYALGKLSNYNIWVLFFFAFIPQILKNHVIHLRQGVALSFYLLGLSSDKKYRNLIKYSSIFIHTSFLFIAFFELAETILKKVKFSSGLRLFISPILIISALYVLPSVAMLLGDRRVDQYGFSFAEGATGLGLLLWLFAGSLFILIIPKNRISIVSSFGIIFYLVSYYFIDFGARVFECVIPLIIVSILNDTRREVRWTYITFFLFYGALQWYLSGFSFFV